MRLHWTFVVAPLFVGVLIGFGLGFKACIDLLPCP